MSTEVNPAVQALLDAVDKNDIDAFLTGFNGPSHFTFQVTAGKVTRMTIRA